MSKKIIYGLILFLIICTAAKAQEQFEKRFDISLSKEPFYSAISKLVKTQSQMGFGYDSIKFSKSLPVTIELRNVTFDEALDTILSTQNIYKDYWVLDYGENKLKDLNLREEKTGAPRYVQRNKSKGRYYHIGDTLPDSSYSITNFSSESFKLSELKGKLVILDLWNVNCGGCILAMPEMERLQQRFDKQIQIILVTRDIKEQVDLLKNRVKIVNNCKLPMVSGENILGSLFDYDQVPTQVWIDENEKITYITKSPISTEKGIQDFLSGKRINLRELKDTVIYPSYDRPLATVLQPIQQGDFGIASYLAPHTQTKYFYGLSSGGFQDSSQIKSLTRLRYGLNDLYRIAYGLERLPKFRIIKNVSQPHKFDVDTLTWSNTYDYELITKNKLITGKRFYRLVQSQLDTYFNLRSYIDKRKIPCYILVSENPNHKLKGTGDPSAALVINGVVKANNVKLSDVIQEINIQRLNLVSPLIDDSRLDPDTHINLNVDIDFDHHLKIVRNMLKTYGLNIKKQKKLIDCLIIEDEK